MGTFFVICSAFLFALKGIFAKLAYLEGAGVDATLFYRFLFCLPLTWLALAQQKKLSLLKKTNKSEILSIAVVAFFGYYLASKFDYLAIDLIGAGISKIIIFTYPVFVIIFSSIYRRAFPTKLEFIVILLTQVGIMLTLNISTAEFQSINVGGVFSILGAISYAIYIILIPIRIKNIDTQYFITWVMSFALIYISIDFLISNSFTELLLSPKAFFWITCMAIFSTTLPAFLFAAAIKSIGASKSALISSCAPIFTFLAAYLILNEQYSLIQIIGSGIIILAIFVLNLKTSKNSN